MASRFVVVMITEWIAHKTGVVHFSAQGGWLKLFSKHIKPWGIKSCLWWTKKADPLMKIVIFIFTFKMKSLTLKTVLMHFLHAKVFLFLHLSLWDLSAILELRRSASVLIQQLVFLCVISKFSDHSSHCITHRHKETNPLLQAK